MKNRFPTKAPLYGIWSGLAAFIAFMSARGQAVWTEQGPGPSVAPGGQGYTEVSGAVQAIAVDPNNSNRVFIAAASGGIWLTTNAMDDHPKWVPLTDQQASLSMGSIAMSPLDPSHNTVFAGFGPTSSGGLSLGEASRGPLLGILKTSDGGSHWTLLGTNIFANNNVAKVVPSPMTTTAGQIIFAAVTYVTGGGPAGLYRSTNDGQGWLRLSGSRGLPDGDANAFVEDPGTPNRLFVASQGNVYRSDDKGDSWSSVSGPTGLPAGAVFTLAMSPSADGFGIHWVYARTGSKVFYTSNLGSTWTLADQPLQGTLEREIAVTPNHPNIAFVESCCPLTYWRLDASRPSGSQLYAVSGANAGGTAPHTDSRDWVFSADPNVMFECDDGGIYRLKNALSNSPVWDSAIGNLRVTEFYSVAYDSVNHAIFGATQDNGDPNQTVTDGIAWGIDEDGADCTCAGADNSSIPGVSIRYHSETYNGGLVRWYYSNPTTASSHALCSMLVPNSYATATLDQCENNLSGNNQSAIIWQGRWQINSADGTRLFLGTDYAYESFDRGDHFYSIGGIGSNSLGNPIPLNPVGTVSAYAYGHPQNADVLYIGTTGNRGHRLWARSGGTGPPTPVDANYGGFTPLGIALDPGAWQRAYLVDSSGHVWRTTDAGTGWVDVTVNLGTFGTNLRSIAVASRSGVPGDVAILVGGLGGVFWGLDTPAGGSINWSRLSTLPNAIVSGLHYDPSDDVLIAGTYGRGAWKIANATHWLFGACYDTVQCDPNVVWLDFAYNGSQTGCYTTPYNTLVNASAHVPIGATLAIKAGSSSATGKITNVMTVQACGGSVIIGH